MKKGFVFSILMAVLLGLFMMSFYQHVLNKEVPEIYEKIIDSREQAAKAVANELAEELPIKVTNGEHKEIQHAVAWPGFSLARWEEFLAIYTNTTLHNIRLDTTNSTLASRVWLAGKNAEYQADDFITLRHNGSYVFLNTTLGLNNYTDCNLDVAGAVKTRIIVSSYDSGTRYTTPGTEYYCYFNFSDGKELKINITASGDFIVDYSNAPNGNQIISFDAGEMYLVFDKYNTTTNASAPWVNSFPGNKRYASIAGMNIIIADVDSNGSYDYAFVDADKNGVFDDADDRLFIKEGIVGLNEKVFYMLFDLGGEWVALYNALGVHSGNAWKGVAY